MEKEINPLFKQLSILHRMGQIYLDNSLKELNIGPGQYVYLIRLYKKDGLSQDELTKWLNIDKGTTAKALKKLEDTGYIFRNVDDKDKRIQRVFLTQKGKDIRKEMLAIISQRKEIIFRDISPQEEQIVLKILSKMASNSIEYIKP